MIAVCCDHGGLSLKKEVLRHLEEKGLEYKDFGTNSPESCDYPVFGERAGKMVASGEADLGILICGTGVGISLAANKVKGVRACVCSEPYSAKLSRMHNDTNILAFGARVVGTELAKMIVDEFFKAQYEGGRHEARIRMLADIEREYGASWEKGAGKA